MSLNEHRQISSGAGCSSVDLKKKANFRYWLNGSLYILLLVVNQVSVLNTVLWPLLVNFLQKRDERYQGTVKLINLKQTVNAMAKNEKDKQTTAHMTQHRKLKNKQHEPHIATWIVSCWLALIPHLIISTKSICIDPNHGLAYCFLHFICSPMKLYMKTFKS